MFSCSPLNKYKISLDSFDGVLTVTLNDLLNGGCVSSSSEKNGSSKPKEGANFAKVAALDTVLNLKNSKTTESEVF